MSDNQDGGFDVGTRHRPYLGGRYPDSRPIQEDLEVRTPSRSASVGTGTDNRSAPSIDPAYRSPQSSRTGGYGGLLPSTVRLSVHPSTRRQDRPDTGRYGRAVAGQALEQSVERRSHPAQWTSQPSVSPSVTILSVRTDSSPDSFASAPRSPSFGSPKSHIERAKRPQQIGPRRQPTLPAARIGSYLVGSRCLLTRTGYLNRRNRLATRCL